MEEILRKIIHVADPSTVIEFLLTYRQYTNPKALMEMLTKRYPE
jgi:hypothetical protein